jgi:hypothetical protein
MGLLQRVFANDVLHCPCGGRRSIIAIVTDAALARALLAGLGLATEPVTFAPARRPAPKPNSLGTTPRRRAPAPTGRRLPAST